MLDIFRDFAGFILLRRSFGEFGGKIFEGEGAGCTTRDDPPIPRKSGKVPAGSFLSQVPMSVGLDRRSGTGLGGENQTIPGGQSQETDHGFPHPVVQSVGCASMKIGKVSGSPPFFCQIAKGFPERDFPDPRKGEIRRQTGPGICLPEQVSRQFFQRFPDQRPVPENLCLSGPSRDGPQSGGIQKNL